MANRLTDRIVLVTGAAGGLGRAFAPPSINNDIISCDAGNRMRGYRG